MGPIVSQSHRIDIRIETMLRPGRAAGLPRASMWGAAFSTVVEWYDFTLYLFMTTVLSRAFSGPARWCSAMQVTGWGGARSCWPRCR
jgi:MHS family proline/betaine transporter-like MFS transporter